MKKEKVDKFFKLEKTFRPLQADVYDELYHIIYKIHDKIESIITIDHYEENGERILHIVYDYTFNDDVKYENIDIPSSWLSNPDWYIEYEKSKLVEEEKTKLEEIKEQEKKDAEYKLYLELKEKYENKNS